MALSMFEKMIMRELKEATGFKKLTEKNLMEWSTTPVEIQTEKGEVGIFLPINKVYVAYTTPK